MQIATAFSSGQYWLSKTAVKQQCSALQTVQHAMLRSLHNFTALHSHTAIWCRNYCSMDCKTKLKPTRIISKQQMWFNSFLHHPTNAGFKETAKTKAPTSWTHFYQRAHLCTEQLWACYAHFPKSSFNH